MKAKTTILFLWTFLMLINSSLAQAPQKFNYQAVARDTDGSLLASQSIDVKIGIRAGSETGTVVWEEIHAVTTNEFGLFSLKIGDPSATKGECSLGTFGEILWSAGVYYLEVALKDEATFIPLGTSELVSVPYAMFAEEGNEGPQGLQGPQGVQGIQGETGPQGLQGGQGIDCWDLDSDGVDDPEEDINSDGVWNALDCKGPEGDQGIQGIQGLQGAVGPDGPQGDQGPVGPTGDTGPQGATGDKGDTGDTGDTGLQGIQGLKGDKGDPGIGLTNRGNWFSGMVVNEGDYVFDRSSGDPLINSMWIFQGTPPYTSTTQPWQDLTNWIEFEAPEGPEGPEGPQGPVGAKGDKGDKGDTGDQGPTGATGATGPVGPKGDTGEQGLQGPKGTDCWDLNGDGVNDPGEDTNNDGQWNAQDCQGEEGDQGSIGPQGDTGPQGDQGPQGIQGPQGAQGSQGEQGIQGEQGTTGAQGPKGDKGDKGDQGDPGDDASDDQDLNIAGDILTIDNGVNIIDLSGYMDNTDAQSLQITGDVLSISGGGGSVDLSIYGDDADADPTNERNTSLVLNGSVLELTDAGGTLTANLGSLTDADPDPTNELNTGAALVGTTFQITDAGGTQNVNLGSLVDDADADPGNELISATTLNGTALEITDAGGIKSVELASLVDDADPDPANELQDLTLTGDDLGLTNSGTTVDLSDYLDDTNYWTRENDSVIYVDGNVGIGTASPQGRLEIMGDGLEVPDEPLFEVKRKDGQTVFAVYPEGVRIYVEDTPDVKGTKGGFAIGGISPIKGVTNEYFRVTPDSIRMYVEKDTVTTKGTKGGFAIGGISPVKGVVDEYFHVSSDSVRIYVEDEVGKGTKGGFAIGGFSPLKGLANEYLRVTPDSVRVYVEKETVKGTKGGFAIGGFSPLKGVEEEYMRVTQDSVRIYINDNPTTKGTKGGFAIGGFSTIKGLTGDYMNVSGKSTAEIIDPSDARVLWYPNKEAFLAGRVLVEHPDSVGENSFATGFESMAKGARSQAFGYKSKARGNYSTAIGFEALASSPNSYAFGNFAVALDSGSYAIGSGATASGLRSFAVGSTGVDSAGVATEPAKSTGDYSYAFGMGSVASGKGAFSMGTQNTADGEYSLALGYNTSATNYYSTSMGRQAEASGVGSMSFGSSTTASGQWSTAIGFASQAQSWCSKALGDALIAVSSAETAIGQFNTMYTPINQHGWDGNDRLFVIGNGYRPGFGPVVRSDAFTVLKDGRVGIGTSTPQYKLDILAGNLGVSTGNKVYWQRLYGTSVNQDKLNIYHRRFMNGSSWTSAEIRIQKTVDATDMGYISFKANDIELGVQDGAAITILQSTNVGIGSSNPQYKLEVSGSLGILSRADLTLNDNLGGSDPGDIIFSAGVAQYARIYTLPYNLVLTTQSNNAPNLKIDNQGYVILDTGLDVYGTIYQRGSVLHADYVFENAYDLESIEDHSRYMWKNKHLPAIPKATKDDEGNDVVEWGTRSRGVLEELEKAHVYIDQLNTAVREQQAMIEELMEEVKELKKRME